MQVRGRHWLLAFVAALAVHVAVAIAMLWQTPSPGAVSAGMGGIEVSLGTSGSPSDAETAADVATPTAEAPATEEVVAEAAPEAAQPAEEAIEIEETEVNPVEPIEEAEVTEAETPREEQSVTPPDTLEVTATELPEPEPTEVAETVEAREVPPTPKPKPERKIVKKQPEPRPVRRAEPRPRQPPPRRELAEAPKPRPTPAPPARPSTAPTASPSQTTAAATAAQSTRPVAQQGATPSKTAEAGGGGMAGAPADYLALLRSWLERHKEYPRRAQLRRQEGTALLYFAMDRQGRVLDYRLQRSSGYPILDGEVEEMIRRAQPLPAAPDGFSGSKLEFVIPVRFHLR